MDRLVRDSSIYAFIIVAGALIGVSLMNIMPKANTAIFIVPLAASFVVIGMLRLIDSSWNKKLGTIGANSKTEDLDALRTGELLSVGMKQSNRN